MACADDLAVHREDVGAIRSMLQAQQARDALGMTDIELLRFARSSGLRDDMPQRDRQAHMLRLSGRCSLEQEIQLPADVPLHASLCKQELLIVRCLSTHAAPSANAAYVQGAACAAAVSLVEYAAVEERADAS